MVTISEKNIESMCSTVRVAMASGLAIILSVNTIHSTVTDDSDLLSAGNQVQTFPSSHRSRIKAFFQTARSSAPFVQSGASKSNQRSLSFLWFTFHHFVGGLFPNLSYITEKKRRGQYLQRVLKDHFGYHGTLKTSTAQLTGI